MIPSKQTVKKLKNKIVRSHQTQIQEKVSLTIERISKQIKTVDISQKNLTGVSPYSFDTKTGVFTTNVPGGEVAAAVAAAFRGCGYECKIEKKIINSRNATAGKPRNFEVERTNIVIKLWDD